MSAPADGLVDRDVLVPQEVVAAVLAAGTTTHTVATVDVLSTVNVRWAANSLTTNGATTSTSVTVLAVVAPAGPGGGSAIGVVTAGIGALDEVAALVEAAEQAARAAGPAPDAQPLLGPDPSAAAEWDAPARRTGIDALAGFTAALGGVLDRAAADAVGLYGYVEHHVRSTWVGSSAGLRVRTDQAEGHLGITARTVARVGAEPVRSAWVGQGFADPAHLDPVASYTELTRRLGWSKRRIDLPPGRYDTILPPDAAADLLVSLSFSLGGRDAADGHSVFSASGDETTAAGRTRLGERVADARVGMASDPAGGGFPTLACADRLVTRSSSGSESVFDTGTRLARTDWIADGVCRALITSRASAADTGLPFAPDVENLVVTVAGGSGSTDDLVAGMARGLLLTCLYYIREVDPRTLLLTGLTRDGVYLVEDGEVVGEVNNFRFNESPLDLLNRFSAAGATVPAVSREWGEYLTRTAMPALRIPDFTMSSVSEAT